MDQRRNPRTRGVLGRRWQLVGLGFVAGAVVVTAVPRVWGVVGALSDTGSPANYSASISPVAVTPGYTPTSGFKVTIHNAEASGSTKYIDYASVTVNSAFAGSASLGLTTPSGWSTFSIGSTVFLRANGAVGTASGPLLPNTDVSVTVSATAPSAPGTYPWATTASYGRPSTRIGSDPTVTVANSVVTCNDGNTCDSGTVTNGTSQVEVFTTATGGPETLGTGYFGTLTCNGHAGTDVFTYSTTNGPATITYKLFNNQTVAPICWQSNTGAAFVLPQCGASSPPPCIASTVVNYDNQEDAQEALNGKINGTEPGDSPETGSVVYTINAPAGDPHSGH